MTDRSDLIDQANLITQQLTDAYVAHARAQNATLPHTGECYNCGDPTPASVNFCDADCRDDWQLRTDPQKRNGKVSEQ